MITAVQNGLGIDDKYLSIKQMTDVRHVSSSFYALEYTASNMFYIDCLQFGACLLRRANIHQNQYWPCASSH
jgi:hypothetical protein